ncbi:hypothetical protein ACRQ5D_34230 [Mucilaginibacter sp. P25]|uniref:hypothetical protein n=1 Tax=Mucilaginibacter sp. P25 TaxID=3423945 RepID=UPI003D7B8920
MLKNELAILSPTLTEIHNGISGANRKFSADFSRFLSEICTQTREAWSTAIFSDHSQEVLIRYFNYHFRFLNDLITEKSPVYNSIDLYELFLLLEHLMHHYGKFLERTQLIAISFIEFRMRSVQTKYDQFINQLHVSRIDESFKKCLIECLSPIYTGLPVEALKLSDLLYREELIAELNSKRGHSELMSIGSLISTLISYNFNHMNFLKYLRKSAIDELQNLPPAGFSKYFAELISRVPEVNLNDTFCFDAKWPHISSMYKDWLSDYGKLLNLTMPREGGSTPTIKAPLTISVKQLACMIRTFYASGFYGHISLTAIFDHAATVFTTKRQEHISAESIANAYYSISQSSAIKVTRMLGSGIEFLKPYCFPG